MSSAGDRQCFSRNSRAPDAPPSQRCEDMKANASVSEICVKKEETLELNICSRGDDLDTTPKDICIKEEDPGCKDLLYCEVCKSFFFNKCEVHGPPVFIADNPVPMGVPDRARQTLPPELEIQESSSPDAGLGVFNKGETVPVGAHFGPYQGELVTKEEGMDSEYSWVISRSRQCEEYIDAKREMHANWMRYVNCARNDEEQNLVAFQYRGEILYRCCRPIKPGQELLVWYEGEYAKDLSPVFDSLWNKKCSRTDVNNAHVQGFSCSTCTLSYASHISLDEHIKKCHCKEYVRLQEAEEIKYELQIPSKGFGSEPKSSGSLSSDASPSDLQKESHHCSDCGKSFGYQHALRTHTCSHVGEKPHHCSQCGKSFYQWSNFQKHERIHTGEKPYHCLQCGKSFTYQNLLQRHQRVHTGEKPYQCSQCGKSFANQSNFQQHKRIHTGVKPYQCSQCGKSFHQCSNFQRHLHNHTEEKPYRCSQCGKGFTYQNLLQRHQRVHTGEKPYHCLQCGKRFAHQSAFLQHQRVHTGEKPHHCTQCGKSFSSRGNLRQHQRVHKGEESNLHLQGRQSLSLQHQRSHAREKPHLCSQCGKSFTYQSHLQEHQRIHTGEKPYHCSQCGKSFHRQSTLKVHQRIHTGEKPYRCSQCRKSFTQQSSFQRHKCTRTTDEACCSSQFGKTFIIQLQLRPSSALLQGHELKL
ncbi:histone-lysine N-methyltransferase PRDM9-like isoform X1 [Clarias gariepinus]|uniref:histone-lysine N-methyltransferase PRDM9-like isoform X1 n=2 Tax=Clarias gariepinus TaxID=13013 RepID=UPI00234CA04F|nr:histone-lysine N-methyltransferase PRDM9-like isoform X1 [Clarias gariepinus]